MRHSKRIRKSPQPYEPGVEATKQWKNDDVAIIFYMIQDWYLNSNVYTDEILSLLSEWDAKYFMNAP